MAERDPEREAHILAKADREEASPRKLPRVPVSPLSRCEKCGSAEVSAQPSFSAGSGTAFRPYADDVYCRRCGHIAPPDLVSQQS
jgi:hypothetical protein